MMVIWWCLLWKKINTKHVINYISACVKVKLSQLLIYPWTCIYHGPVSIYKMYSYPHDKDKAAMKQFYLYNGISLLVRRICVCVLRRFLLPKSLWSKETAFIRHITYHGTCQSNVTGFYSCKSYRYILQVINEKIIFAVWPFTQWAVRALYLPVYANKRTVSHNSALYYITISRYNPWRFTSVVCVVRKWLWQMEDGGRHFCWWCSLPWRRQWQIRVSTCELCNIECITHQYILHLTVFWSHSGM